MGGKTFYEGAPACPLRAEVQGSEELTAVHLRPLWEELAKPEGPAAEFEDELLPEVLDIVLHEQRASISLLQRKLRIGYTRAARIMDILERHGVVGPQPPGGQAREVFPQAARLLLQPQEPNP